MNFLERFWSGCSHCRGQSECPLAEDLERASNDPGQARRGSKLVGSAVAVFILPLVGAIAGGHLAGSAWAENSFGSVGRWQSGGILAGLLVGVVLAKLLLKCMSSSWLHQDGGGR